MATTTTNLGLTKPAYADAADVAVFNTNMDLIDSAIGGLQTRVSTAETNITNLQSSVNRVDNKFRLAGDATAAGLNMWDTGMQFNGFGNSNDRLDMFVIGESQLALARSVNNSTTWYWDLNPNKLAGKDWNDLEVQINGWSNRGAVIMVYEANTNSVVVDAYWNGAWKGRKRIASW